MSETVKKPWTTVIGTVEAFTKNGVKEPAVKQGDANGQPVYNLTIKTLTQGKFIDIALWSEYAHVAGQIQDGYLLVVGGPVTVREHNGNQYFKIDAKKLTIVPTVVPQEREVVNQVGQNSTPAAVAAAPAAAPVADQTFSF